MEIPASLLMSSGVHAYIALRGSLDSSDCVVYGLSNTERQAIGKRFKVNEKYVAQHGIVVETHPLEVINALGQLG